MPEIITLNDEQKLLLAKVLGSIAQKYKIKLQTCATNIDYTNFGIQTSGCMTLDILGKANGVKFKDLKHRGMRKNCNCIETKDIGAYDTCPNGCKYCYANSTPKRALENYKLHDKNSLILLGKINDSDIIQQGNQKSFLLFDQNLKLF